MKTDLQTLTLPASRADLITTADVFMYLGALERIFATVASALSANGLFAFTAERHDGPDDYRLRESRRYAHSEDYLRRLLAHSGFTAVSMQSDTIRRDRGAPIVGLIVTARRAEE